MSDVTPATAIVDEVIDEAIKKSGSKRPLIVLVLIAGAVGAFVLIRRARSAELEMLPADGESS